MNYFFGRGRTNGASQETNDIGSTDDSNGENSDFDNAGLEQEGQNTGQDEDDDAASAQEEQKNGKDEDDDAASAQEEQKNGKDEDDGNSEASTPKKVPSPPPRAPPPVPPKKPSFLSDSSALVKSETITKQVEMEPEEFFRDFKLYFDRKLSQVEAASESGNARMIEGLIGSVKNMHIDLSNALSHLGTALESDMMDLRYLTQLPDTNLFNIANKCEFHEIDAFALTKLEEAFQEQYKFDNTVSKKLRCDNGTSVWDRMKNERQSIKYFIVTCCVFHHYHIENLSHVSILSRTRMIIEENGRDYLMFVYLLKRGL